MFHSVNLLSQAPIARGSCALPSVLFNKHLVEILVIILRLAHCTSSAMLLIIIAFLYGHKTVCVEGEVHVELLFFFKVTSPHSYPIVTM